MINVLNKIFIKIKEILFQQNRDTKEERRKMKKEIKNKHEKGITLIALVVTIVVLLILAGVSISLVLNNNGVISKAKDAKNQYAEAQTNDEKQLNEVSDWIDTKVGDTTGGGSAGGSDYDPASDGVPIPDGYYYVGGTKAKGIVISDNVADKELDKGKENVRRDLAGNQWVWVPVETPSSLYTTVTEGVALSGSTGVKTTKYTNSAIISGITRGLPGNTNFREPDILTDSSYDDTNFATAGFSSLANMAETMVNEYEEMIRSIENYKGFYIGRYELTADGEKTGATQTCGNGVNWYTLYKNCTTLATGSKVKTRMIWGLQWDATCKWLDSSGFSITDSSTWGNYYNNTADGHGSKQNTGFSESWKANNIYDFAGNYWKFTQEAHGTCGRAGRGGSYRSDGSSIPGSGGPASARFSSIPTDTNSIIGSRPTLYLIP